MIDVLLSVAIGAFQGLQKVDTVALPTKAEFGSFVSPVLDGQAIIRIPGEPDVWVNWEGRGRSRVMPEGTWWLLPDQRAVTVTETLEKLLGWDQPSPETRSVPVLKSLAPAQRESLAGVFLEQSVSVTPSLGLLNVVANNVFQRFEWDSLKPVGKPRFLEGGLTIKTAVSPKGRWLAHSGGERLVVSSLTGAPGDREIRTDTRVVHLAWLNESRLLLAGVRGDLFAGPDSVVQVIDTASGTVREIRAFAFPVRVYGFSTDGSFVLLDKDLIRVMTIDKSLIASGKSAVEFQAAALSVSGKWVWTLDQEGVVSRWKVPRG